MLLVLILEAWVILRNKKDFNYVKKHVSRRGIILLQEAHGVQKDEKVWTNQFGCGKGSVIFSHSKSIARGALVAFREVVNDKIISQHVHNNGRYIVLNLLIDSQSCNTCSVFCGVVSSTQYLIFLLMQMGDLLSST